MFTAMLKVIRQINTPSAAEVEGLALLARIDDEAVALEAVVQGASCAEPALLAIARARLAALREAAIAARGFRPENIRFSGALACLQQGAVFAPMVGQAASQYVARVA